MKTKPGDLIKIPYNNNMHTYARILSDGNIAAYDYPTKDDVSDYRLVTGSEILFIVMINRTTIWDGGWTVLVNIPLEANLINLQTVFLAHRHSTMKTSIFTTTIQK